MDQYPHSGLLDIRDDEDPQGRDSGSWLLEACLPNLAGNT